MLVFSILSFVTCIAGLHFLVALVYAVFSEKIRSQIKKHPVWHGIWACFGLGCLAFTYFFSNFSTWPPHWWELHTQRRQVLERIQSAGGWEKLRQDCIALTKTNESVEWYRGTGSWTPVSKSVASMTNDQVLFGRNETNGWKLPPAIATLKPQFVTYDFKKYSGVNSMEFNIVRIHIFGMHSTGGHSIPNYKLEVITDASSEAYASKAYLEAHGQTRIKYQKASEGIYYEVF